MSQPNRRNALALVATLPALAAPAAVAAMGSPDAELLRLGEQLDQVIKDYNAQQLKDRPGRELFEAKVEQVTGVARHNAPASWDEESPAAVAYYEARSAIARADHSDTDEECPWTPIHGRLYPIVDAILSRSAHSLAGLAVQARAAVMAAAEIWDAPGEETERERLFIESVCAFVGVKPERLLLLDRSAPDQPLAFGENPHDIPKETSHD
jgi:hypothetical protein